MYVTVWKVNLLIPVLRRTVHLSGNDGQVMSLHQQKHRNQIKREQ